MRSVPAKPLPWLRFFCCWRERKPLVNHVGVTIAFEQKRRTDMKNILALFTSNSMARDYAIAGVVTVILTIFAIHTLSAFVETTRGQVRVQTATLEQRPETVRNYQISRSVLDDTVVTGSISKTQGGRPIILDPCTGQIKSQ